MSSYSKSVAWIYLAFAIIVVGAIAAGALLFSVHSKVRAVSPTSLTYHANANGPYTVRGNSILGADGQPYIFHGIGRDGLEFNCSGEGPLDKQHLAYMGSGVNTDTETYWGGNTIRLPLSEGFWLHGAPGYACTASQYQSLVKQTVNNITALHLNAMLDLQWTDAAGQSRQGGGPRAMPDADSVTFWSQVASIYAKYSNVLFELYNEPHPSSWSCWLSGCPIKGDTVSSDDCKCAKTLSYQSVGMQTLVSTVRNAGANNLVLVGGMNWGYDLSQITKYAISGSNVVYDTHPYDYADKAPSMWDAGFGNISAKYPVISGESGEYDCGSDYMSQLLPYFDAHNIGWIGWAWSTAGGCSSPLLVSDYQGTPYPGMGEYIYQYLQSYAPAPATAPARMNNFWSLN
ncbi:MAG: cellulase family glycosylhydrolase [Chloroflexi bacterium]|nr:cellulase family glycosylhydrolase [Ktedonobacteraceae bacterium]MBV9707948.1 cellulase family glycosylhydrolase [Chloroflexota bacterium]